MNDVVISYGNLTRLYHPSVIAIQSTKCVCVFSGEAVTKAGLRRPEHHSPISGIVLLL